MKSKNLFFILFSSFLFGQTSFNYQRDWGTFFGGTNSYLTGIYEDSSSDISVDIITTVLNPPGSMTPVSYYNQFITSGSQSFIGNNSNNMYGKFSSAGNLLQAEYISQHLNGSRKSAEFRDHAGNMYEFESNLISFPILPLGVWISANNDFNDVILTKYNANNVVEWRTYLPGTDSFNHIEVDDNGNIYIAGLTKWQNLADPGTFQPNFNLVYDTAGLSMPNSYLVKLNPQGQKIWATYTPSSLIGGMTIYNNDLYIFGNNDVNPTGADLSTAGTFQVAKAAQFISKINGNTGQRVWGTYYGTPGNISDGGMADIKADATGVYVIGMSFASGSYYSTEGAYRTQTNDGFDVFITKFDDSGNRSWSTYIGSDNYESFSGDRSLDIKNGKLLFTGITSGSQNVATPGAYIDINPNPDNSDAFFGILNTNTGQPDFISYYGGVYNNPLEGFDVRCSFSKHSDGFYLFGATYRNNGFTSSNGYQPAIIYPAGVTLGRSGFIAKFSPKVLAASEVKSSEDLVVYNNPSNGNFSIKGSVLERQPHIVSINDMAGRLIYSENIPKTKESHFYLENKLSNGNYLLSVKKRDHTLVKSVKLIIKK